MVLRIFKMIPPVQWRRNHQWPVTSGFLAALKCTKFVFGRGSAPDSTVGAYSAPLDPLAAGWRALLLSGGREGKGKQSEEGERKEIRKFLDPPWTGWLMKGNIPVKYIQLVHKINSNTIQHKNSTYSLATLRRNKKRNTICCQTTLNHWAIVRACKTCLLISRLIVGRDFPTFSVFPLILFVL